MVIGERAITLAEQFYDWDHRLRGYDVWPYPVSPEPMFVPFNPWIDTQPVADDTRSHTLLSWVTEKVKHAVTGQSQPEQHFEPLDDKEYVPELYLPLGDIVELQLSLPAGVEYPRTRFEQLLGNLKGLHYPLSFELIANAEIIVVQLSCREADAPLLTAHLTAFFPEVVVTSERHFLARHLYDADIGVSLVNFGLDRETAVSLPSQTPDRIDSLATVISALSLCEDEEVLVLQFLMAPVRAPWATALTYAVQTPDGSPFFADAPGITKAAMEKTRQPLFGAVLRICAISHYEDRRQQLLRQLGAALSQFNVDRVQGLIPLTNDDYPDDVHLDDIVNRRTHRSGMLLSAPELTGFVHLPLSSVVSPKLIRPSQKTKEAPRNARGHAFVLGTNDHRGLAQAVSLSLQQRMRHSYIVGASGTGKSTLLLNLIRQDMAAGHGVALLDPHGDLVDDVLQHVPEGRIEDVVLLDPADEAYPVGLNIFDARSEAEKTLLASDLVAVFRRLSTSWGDQMNAILANSIIAMLEHEEGGTLLTLRRFLVENAFRRQYLKRVKDDEVRYYWEKEYPLLRGKPHAPVLTRLDTFLRSKLIRHMVAQPKNNVDFSVVMDERKIFLARLSHGAIGEENAHLLGTLLVTTLNQAAQRRQAISREDREPFFVYIDEFQNFVTPTMESILSGSRKFNMALTLAHQDLRQLASRSQDVAHSVLSNPSTRICFRCGDSDAVTLARGFSSFDAEDLQRLGIGQAIVRLEQSQYDCNLTVAPPPESPVGGADRAAAIIERSQQRYGTPLAEVQDLLVVESPASPVEDEKSQPTESARAETSKPKEKPSAEARRKAPPGPVQAPEAPAQGGRGGSHHRYLQSLVKKLALERGFKVEVEAPVLGRHGHIDVLLSSGNVKIACEVSVSTPSEYELQNVNKCLSAGVDHVVILGYEKHKHATLAKYIKDRVEPDALKKLHILLPDTFLEFLDTFVANSQSAPKTVRGYKVKVNYKETSKAEQKQKQAAIAKLIVDSMRRMNG